MKKFMATAALIGMLGISGISLANARGGYGYGYGSGYCDGPRYCDNRFDSAGDNEKAEAFFEDTKELRKEIIVKKSELDAMMRQDNPDEKKVAALTGELFDLRSRMQEKAGKAFDGTPRPGYGPGPGYGGCRMSGGW